MFCSRSRLTFGVLIAKSTLPHIGKFDGAFGARIHEPIAALWVELCSRDNFGQLLHVCRLDVNNVEALVLNVQIPQVYPQVVTANKCLSVTVHGYAVDMVGVCVGVCLPGNSRNDGIMMCEPRHLEVSRTSEVHIVVPYGSTSTEPSRSEVMAKIVLRNHFQ